jgi:hypothetical protein
MPEIPGGQMSSKRLITLLIPFEQYLSTNFRFFIQPGNEDSHVI